MSGMLSLSGSSNLPSITTEDPIITRITPFIQLSNDLYKGLNIVQNNSSDLTNYEPSNFNKMEYLIRTKFEPRDSYEERYKRSFYINLYKPTIVGFAGLLSDVKITTEPHPSLIAYIDDVDLQGNDLTTFLNIVDKKSFIDGWVGVFTDYDNQKQRPYFRIVPKRTVINCDEKAEEMVVIKTTNEKRSNRYLKESVTNYLDLGVGEYRTAERNSKGVIEYEAVEMTDVRGQRLPRIPFVFYTRTNQLDNIEDDSSNPLGILPPLIDVAFSNLAHYRKLSEYHDFLHKCNLPVAVRKGAASRAKGSDEDLTPPLIIATNTVIDLPPEGSFEWVEPSGTAVDASRQDIIDIETNIAKQSLAFFSAENGTGMTDTEASLRSSQVKSSLKQLCTDKKSAVNKLFRDWAMWYGESNDDKDYGQISIDDKIFSSNHNMEVIDSIIGLGDRGYLDTETIIEIVKEADILPQNVTAEEVLERIKNHRIDKKNPPNLPEDEDGEDESNGNGNGDEED